MSQYKINQTGTLPDLKLEMVNEEGVGIFDIPVHVADRFRVVRHEYISLINQLLHEKGLGDVVDHGEPHGTIDHLVHPLARNP